MKPINIIIILCLICCINIVFAAQNTWTAADSATNTNWSNGSNWSLTTKPGASDTVIFDGSGGSKTPTVDENISVKKIISTSGFSRNLSFSGRSITTDGGGLSFNGTGTLNIGNIITLNGASDSLHISSGSGTVTGTACTVIVNGATGCIMAIKKTAVLKKLIVNGILINNNTVTINIGTTGTNDTLLSINNGATLTQNRPIELQPKSGGSSYIIQRTPSTFNGSNGVNIYGASTSEYVRFKKIIYTGSGNFTQSLVGNISIEDTFDISSNGTFTWTNVFASPNNMKFINTGIYFKCGQFTIGATSSGSMISSFGSSSYNITALISNNSGTATIIDSLQTSSWSCAGNWSFGANHIIIPGTSTIAITNTSTVTTAGKDFYNFIANASTKLITIVNRFKALGDLTLTAGRLKFAAGSRDTIVGSYYNNGDVGDTTLRNGDTMWIGASMTRGANSNVSGNTGPMYFYTDVLSNITSSGKTLGKIYVHKSTVAGQVKIIDAFRAGFLIDSVGTYNTNGQTTTIDTAMAVYDSLVQDALITAPTCQISPTAKLNIKTGGKYNIADSMLIKCSFGLVSDSSYFGRIRPDSGITVTLPSGNGTKIGTYTAPYDLEGVAGNVVSIKSSTPGTRTRLWGLTNGDTLTYAVFKDCSSSVRICLDSFSRDSTNNRNIRTLSVYGVTHTTASGVAGVHDTVNGWGFTGNCTLSVAGKRTALNKLSYKQAWYAIPDTTPGAYTAQAINSSLDSAGFSLTILASSPIIDSLSPAHGTTSDSVTAYVQNSTLGSTATVGGTSVTLGYGTGVVGFRMPLKAIGDYDFIYTDSLGRKDTATLSYDTIPIMISSARGHGKLTGTNYDTLTFDYAAVIDSVYYGTNKATISGGTATKKYITVPNHAKGVVSILSFAHWGYKDTLVNAYEYANIYNASITPTKAKGGNRFYVTAEYGLTTLTVKIGDSTATVYDSSDTKASGIFPIYTKGKYNDTLTNGAGDQYIILNGSNFNRKRTSGIINGIGIYIE